MAFHNENGITLVKGDNRFPFCTITHIAFLVFDAACPRRLGNNHLSVSTVSFYSKSGVPGSEPLPQLSTVCRPMLVKMTNMDASLNTVAYVTGVKCH